MSSDTRERPESGTIEDVPLSEVEIDLTTYVAELDSAVVVEIGTSAIGNRRLRVYVNDGPVFDQEPEQHGPHGECGFMFQDETGERHRCTVTGSHVAHFCNCGVGEPV